MVHQAALSHQEILRTERLRLEQLGPAHFEGVWDALQDEEAMRLTGTRAEFTPEIVRAHLQRLPGNEERADWAIVRLEDDRFLGEIVLNDLDPDNASMNLRISLNGAESRGQGYGTEAVQTVASYAFGTIGLHRISLSVFPFNPRAIRVYEKCGFRREGVEREAFFWNGEWHDNILMSRLATDLPAAA